MALSRIFLIFSGLGGILVFLWMKSLYIKPEYDIASDQIDKAISEYQARNNIRLNKLIEQISLLNKDVVELKKRLNQLVNRNNTLEGVSEIGQSELSGGRLEGDTSRFTHQNDNELFYNLDKDYNTGLETEEALNDIIQKSFDPGEIEISNIECRVQACRLSLTPKDIETALNNIDKSELLRYGGSRLVTDEGKIILIVAREGYDFFSLNQ